MIIITAQPNRLCEPGFTNFTLYDDGKEEVTTMDAEGAYRYAYNVINDRFPEGEKAISQDAQWAYRYAYDVIKGRWPEGEKAIAQNAQWACYYALYVIGRWPEGEEVIARNAQWAYYYAFYIIKDRFRKGEEAISQNEELWEAYNDRFKDFIYDGKVKR